MPKEPKAPSLAKAELRLEVARRDLEKALNSIEDLNNSGQPEEAIRIIDLQRKALLELPAQVASELAASPKKPLRRLAVLAAATAFSLFATVAGAVGVINSRESATERVGAGIQRAVSSVTLDAKLIALEDALEAFSGIKIEDPLRAELARELADEASKTSEEAQESQADEELVAKAAQIEREAKLVVPPSPGQGKSPLAEHLPNL